MIRLNDHYFISWLHVVKKYEIEIIDKKVFINMNSKEYKESLIEYKETLKPVLTEIRKNVRYLNSVTT